MGLREEMPNIQDIAFVLDPDNYWIELLSTNASGPSGSWDKAENRFNHTMIRVKDPVKSREFYEGVLGMSLVCKKEFPEAKFDLYFLGYNKSTDGNKVFAQETLLELTHNYGTESDPDFHYHNGNAQPQGFGHICVSVPDLEKACAEFEAKGVDWQKRLTDGRMHNIAFIKDPDSYWVEIIGQE